MPPDPSPPTISNRAVPLKGSARLCPANILDRVDFAKGMPRLAAPTRGFDYLEVTRSYCDGGGSAHLARDSYPHVTGKTTTRLPVRSCAQASQPKTAAYRSAQRLL